MAVATNVFSSAATYFLKLTVIVATNVFKLTHKGGN